MSRPVDPSKKPDVTKPSIFRNNAEKLTDAAVAGDKEAKRSLIERKKMKDINKEEDAKKKLEESVKKLKKTLENRKDTFSTKTVEEPVEKAIIKENGQWELLSKSGYNGYKPEANQQRKASRTGTEVAGAGPNKGQRAYSGNPARPATYKQVENEQKKMKAHAKTPEGKGKSLKDADPEKYAKLKAELEAKANKK